jgi:hypothetical protein
MQKLNVAAKKLSTGKWYTWGYGTKFDDKDGKEGNLVLKFKVDQLHALLEAVKTGEIQVNQYGYAEFAVFKDTYSNNNASPLNKPALKVEVPVINPDFIPF